MKSLLQHARRYNAITHLNKLTGRAEKTCAPSKHRACIIDGTQLGRVALTRLSLVTRCFALIHTHTHTCPASANCSVWIHTYIVVALLYSCLNTLTTALGFYFCSHKLNYIIQRAAGQHTHTNIQVFFSCCNRPRYRKETSAAWVYHFVHSTFKDFTEH